MTFFSKMTLAGAAALAMGAAVAATPVPAAASYAFSHHRPYHHTWRVRPHGLPYAYGYGQAPHGITGYYFTTSDFCIPDRNNDYNGDFSTLAYGANGRPLGYVCQ